MLELTSVWYISSAVDSKTVKALEMFRLTSEGFVMAPNVGLAGRVWFSKIPELIPFGSDQSENYFLRSKLARACGVKTGLGIPLMINHQVWAVLILFKTI